MVDKSLQAKEEAQENSNVPIAVFGVEQDGSAGKFEVSGARLLSKIDEHRLEY